MFKFLKNFVSEFLEELRFIFVCRSLPVAVKNHITVVSKYNSWLERQLKFEKILQELAGAPGYHGINSVATSIPIEWQTAIFYLQELVLSGYVVADYRGYSLTDRGRRLVDHIQNGYPEHLSGKQYA